MTQGDFQSQVNTAQAPAVAGDFASKNPRYSYLAGPGGLVAGPGGVLVGHFAWAYNPPDGDGTPGVVLNTGSGLPSGFVHREQQALIVNYLASSGNTIQPGFGMTLMTSGDFWVVNSGSAQALPGQKAYANFADGSIVFAATGSPSGATASSWSLAPQTETITASMTTPSVLTVTAATGTYGVTVGAGLTGGTGPSSNTIVSQVLPLLAGEALGGIGRYNVSNPECTIGATYTGTAFSLLTLTTVSAGTFAVNDVLSSTTPLSPLLPVITQILTGTGGSGTTAITSTSQTASSGTLTGASNIETDYYCRSSGLTGELVKISKTLQA